MVSGVGGSLVKTISERERDGHTHTQKVESIYIYSQDEGRERRSLDPPLLREGNDRNSKECSRKTGTDGTDVETFTRKVT